MAEEARLSPEALPEAGSTDSGTLYPNFKRNRFLGVTFLGIGLAGVLCLVLNPAGLSGDAVSHVNRGGLNLFWVFCGAAYLQHPHTRLRDWMRRAAITSLALASLGAGALFIYLEHRG